MVVTEALAHGIPVLATRVGGLPGGARPHPGGSGPACWCRRTTRCASPAPSSSGSGDPALRRTCERRPRTGGPRCRRGPPRAPWWPGCSPGGGLSGSPVNRPASALVCPDSRGDRSRPGVDERQEAGIDTSWWRWARPLGGALVLGALVGGSAPGRSSTRCVRPTSGRWRPARSSPWSPRCAAPGAGGWSRAGWAPSLTLVARRRLLLPRAVPQRHAARRRARRRRPRRAARPRRRRRRRGLRGGRLGAHRRPGGARRADRRGPARRPTVRPPRRPAVAAPVLVGGLLVARRGRCRAGRGGAGTGCTRWLRVVAADLRALVRGPASVGIVLASRRGRGRAHRDLRARRAHGGRARPRWPRCCRSPWSCWSCRPCRSTSPAGVRARGPRRGSSPPPGSGAAPGLATAVAFGAIALVAHPARRGAAARRPARRAPAAGRRRPRAAAPRCWAPREGRAVAERPVHPAQLRGLARRLPRRRDRPAAGAVQRGRPRPGRRRAGRLRRDPRRRRHRAGRRPAAAGARRRRGGPQRVARAARRRRAR